MCECVCACVCACVCVCVCGGGGGGGGYNTEYHIDSVLFASVSYTYSLNRQG